MFQNNFVWGIGTGNYQNAVQEYLGISSGAHNELIRAAAEHGVLGIFAWCLFMVSSLFLVLSSSRGKVRALRMAFVMIFFLYLAVNGLKLILQPLLLLISLSYSPSYSITKSIAVECENKNAMHRDYPNTRQKGKSQA